MTHRQIEGNPTPTATWSTLLSSLKIRHTDYQAVTFIFKDYLFSNIYSIRIEP